MKTFKDFPMLKYLLIAFLFMSIALFMSCKEDNVEPIQSVNQPELISVETNTPDCQTLWNANMSVNNSIYTINYYNSTDTLNVQFVDPDNNLTTNDIIFNYIKFVSCSNRYKIRETDTSIVTVIDQTIIINYNDCLLPLQGISGSIEIKIQQ